MPAGLKAEEAARITMSGGRVGTWFAAEGQAGVTLSGGTLDADLQGLDAARVLVKGGRVTGELVADDRAHVYCKGRIVEGELTAQWSGVLTIEGRDFAVDGEPAPYGEVSARNGRLTGALASGDPVDNTFWRNYAVASTTSEREYGEPLPAIVLVPVPEPAAALCGAVAAGALAVLGGRRRGRRR